MPCGIDKMETETGIVELGKWFEEKYGITVKDLKRKIAQKSINITKSRIDFPADDKKTVVRLFRGRKKFLIQQIGCVIDRYTNEERFRYDFPLFLINEEPEIEDCISKEGLEEILTRELVDHNFEGFNEVFEEFLIKLYNWEHGVN